MLFGLSLLYGWRRCRFCSQSRLLAQRDNPVGSSKVVLGKPRFCGMTGIEIVLEQRSADGSVIHASVQDLLGSWKEAIVKYEDPEGGGLLMVKEEQ